MDHRLVDENVIETFNAKELYKQVLHLFDEYYAYKVCLEDAVTNTYNKKIFHEEQRSYYKSDPTYQRMLRYERAVTYIEHFEKELLYLKKHFTKEETNIFNTSILNRIPDKEIMIDINKKGHTYYKLKKSCYLKIALRFNLIHLKDNKKN